MWLTGYFDAAYTGGLSFCYQQQPFNCSQKQTNMTSILKNNLIQFNNDTLHDVRKEFNLDQPGQMDQNINVLQDWVQKQDHFVKKDFGREYLERFIISAKGSVEKAKTRLDRLCTLRTVAPNLFEKSNPKTDLLKIPEFFLQVVMPELTDDNYRILTSKMIPTKIKSSDYFLEAYQHCVMICEYMKLHDYAQGYYIIVDLNDVNITDIVTNLKFNDFRNILTVIIEGYGIRMKGVYVITPSKVINALVKIVKQIVSAKIAERINVVKTAEDLHEVFPKRLLPEEFGGEQKSIMELFSDLNEELSSESHVSHMMDMRHANTTEKLRRKDKLNEDYLGMPGSLQQLTVD